MSDDDSTMEEDGGKTIVEQAGVASGERSAERDDGLYFLIRCVGHRSLELRRGQTIAVGRQSDNDLVLNDGTVSRHHAELRWDPDEDRPHVIDLGSANGVEVDGEPVEVKAYLSGGNQVDVGDFTVVLQIKGSTNRYRRQDALIKSETLQTNRSMVRLFSEKGKALKGSIDSAEDLMKLLLDLEQNERTGTLKVSSGIQAWRTTFSQGLIVTCYQDEEHGEDLLDAMLDVVKGSYEFTLEIEPSEECLNLSPAAIYKRRG